MSELHGPAASEDYKRGVSDMETACREIVASKDDIIESQRAQVRTLQARVAELEEGLRPFAEEADAWIEMGDTRPVIGNDSHVTVAHLRRARALVEKGT